MLQKCSCGNTIPSSISINNKIRDLRNRKWCLSCVPFSYSQSDNQTKVQKTSISRLNRMSMDSKKYFLENRIKLVAKGSRFLLLRKQLLVDSCGGKCLVCGYNKYYGNLVFHHINPEEKKFLISSNNLRMPLLKLYDEIQKCLLLCHNCHGEVHQCLINIEHIKMTINKDFLFSEQCFDDEFRCKKCKSIIPCYHNKTQQCRKCYEFSISHISKSPDMIDIIDLIQNNKTFEEIGKIYNVSRVTIRNKLKKAGIKYEFKISPGHGGQIILPINSILSPATLL